MKNWFRQLQMALARSGKKYRVLKYPILLLLLLMAAICRGIDAVGTLTRPAVRRRVMAAALSVCMVFTMLPMQTFAAKPTQNAGSLCEHHSAHRLECGYTEGTAGSPCTHEHRSDCYIEVTDCTHEHMAECYPEDDSVSDNDATPSDAEEKEPTECSHICDEDTGCITQELDCPHDRGEHDDTCGYAEGTEGTPCTYICDICNPVEDDAEKQILAIAAPKVVQGIEWEIDDTGCLTISTQAGMTDWKDNGKLTNKSNVKTVTIANDVTKIPSQAFEDCTELTSVSAPGAKSIASYAFNRCEKLASVHIPGALSIGSTAFMNCAELTSVTFPVATSIQSYAFAGCKKLASAYIPEAVSIGSNAFDGCAELTSASFPVAKNIMPYAFSGCTTLATLSLPVAPPSVTDTNAFQGCPSPRVLVLVDADGTELTGMALTEAKAAYKAVNDGDTTDNLWYGWIIEEPVADNGWEIDASGNLTISTSEGMTDWVANGRDTNKSNLKTATIAKGILSIDKDAFKNCTKLTSVSISDGVTFIGNSAFWGCTKLTSVIIPDSVITIENFAFISTGLTSVTFKSTKPPTLGRTIFLNTPDNLIIYVPQGSVDAYKEVSTLSDMKDKIKVAGLPSESIPTATFTATGSATGTLSNVSTGMKYSTNGTNWTEISSGADISLTGLSPCTISVVKKGDGTTTSDSEAQTISVTQAAQPTGVGKTDETVAKNDGTITGVTTAMEYKLSTSSTYTDISSTTVTGLAPGTYQVRTKATGTVLASADTSVTIDTVVTLISIAVTTQPTKTTYIAGEYFDTAGMVITATYSNNNTAVVTGYSVSSSGALAASDTTVTISYTKDGITKTTDVTITVKAKINAVAPTISTDLSETEVTYIKDAAATALSISATASDSGTLSYEWYSNTTNSTTGGTKLTGTAAIYTPSTASTGTTYYYCIVTNTITDNGDGGTKTATATSAVANIKVEAAPVDKGWAIDASGNLTISTVAGMTDWVAMGRDANKDSVKTATIAETVLEIPIEAFKNCSVLTNVTANGAISISANAFMSCNKLATVEFLKTKTIGAYAFAYCSKLVAVKFPETKTIGDSAFSGCKALTSVSFPETTSIVRYAFWECETLTSASFPKATTIGVSAFNDCKALATLKLGATPPTVGTDAFIVCPATRALAFVDGGEKPLTDDALTAAQVNYKGFADGNTTDNLWYGWTIDKGWRIDASGNLTISTADGMTDWVTNGLSVNETTVKTAIIDEAVTEIPSDAFKQCSVLTNVTANGATNIGSYAFYDCIALTSASFPAAKTIGFYSFRGCEALTSASFPAAETIGNTAFRACKALTSTSFPAVETIANSAFSDCTALTSASFPKVETIGESAFYGCTALTSANFPVVATIGRAAFYDCSKLATLKLPAAPPSAPAASTFGKCPATRALALVDAEGTALTGDALTNAQAAYKAVNDGDATDTLWYGWKIDVAPPTTPTVTSVAVTPETASVQQGNTQQFTAAVTGTNSPAQTVTWKVTGGKTGTSISTGGLLTVASDETAATLAVTATSTVDTTKSGTATVTVTSTPVTKYTLTVTNGTGGGSYEAGASVTATANAAPSNQHFKEWTATGLTGVMLTDSPLTFQMPAGAVTLTAVYEADPPVVTVDKSALITAIANAKSIMANTVISVQGGADVSTSTYWVLPDIMSAAKSALSEAEAIVVKADGTQAEVDNAAVKLNAKVNIDFKNAKKAGTKSSGGGGGSSSGGSGGSSSGTTPPPSQPVVKIPGTGQATIPATVDQNGNANVSVTDKNITDAIADAKKDAVQGQPITVEIKVNTDKDASQLITTLPQSVRDTLINNQVGSLTIGNKDVSMNFSQAALGQMNAQAQGNLIITATKADTGKLMGNAQTLIGNRPTYEFKATCDGRIITDLGANAVTITIPYILKEGETAANIQAIRMDANGVATVIPGSFYDVTKQAVVFTTGQVSATYGIGCRQTTASSIHRVQRGETLAAIARRYQTTVQAIAALNGISNPNRIEIGQEIQIPQ